MKQPIAWKVKWAGIGAAAILIGTGGFITACSGDDAAQGGEGDSCQIDADCEQGLLCRNEQCVQGATSNNGTPSNNNGNNGADNNSSVVPVEAEDFYISYLLENRNPSEEVGNRALELKLRSTLNDTVYTLSPEGIDCSSGNSCDVSNDLKHFVYTTPNADVAGMNDVYVSPISSEFEVALEASPLIEQVRGVRLVGDLITYIKEDGEAVRAYFRELPDGAETEIGVLGAVGSNERAMHVDAKHRKVVLYTPTLHSVDIGIGNLGEEVVDFYTMDAQNFQGPTGSHYIGMIPSAISKDGRYLAMLTTAPNDYEACETTGAYSQIECPGPGRKCGEMNMCTAYEVSFHFFDLENLDTLGQNCDSDAACGSIYSCYNPHPAVEEDDEDTSRCVPKTVVMGLPKEPYQGSPAQSGCGLTTDNADYTYTNIRTPIEFGPDGYLYATGVRNCAPDELNIEQTAIIKVHPEKEGHELVFGNPGEDFDESRCYNEAERAVDVRNCIVHIESARLSPGGNQLVFLATNPDTVVDANLAGRMLDLWTVQRDGQRHAWIGGHNLTRVVRAYKLHPIP